MSGSFRRMPGLGVATWRALALLVAFVAASLVITGPAAPKTGAAPAQAPPTTYTNGTDVGSNPFVLKVGGTYYRYISGFDYGSQLPVPAATSTDLVHWAWVPGTTVLAPSAVPWADAATGWNFSSPSVLAVPNDPVNPTSYRYVLYFTAKLAGSSQRCIGRASAAGPAGPFTSSAPLVCPSSTSVDAVEASPHPVVPTAQYQQIVYRKTGGDPGIYIQVLTQDGLSPHPNQPERKLLSAQPRYWANGGRVEQPSVVPTLPLKVQLFYSGTDVATGADAIGSTTCNTGFGLVIDCKASPPDGGQLAASGPEALSPSSPEPFSDGPYTWLAYQAAGRNECSGSGCATFERASLDKLCFVSGAPRTNAPTRSAQPLARNGTCTTDIPGRWTGSWSAALSPGGRLPDRTNGSTWRQTVHTSIGGRAVRVRISNIEEGRDAPSAQEALTINKATFAVKAHEDHLSTGPSFTSEIAPSTLRNLTFGGSPSVTVAAGKEVISDPVVVDVPPDRDVAVSIYIPGTPPSTTSSHLLGWQYSYFDDGDHVSDTRIADGEPNRTFAAGHVSGVDVLADPEPVGSVAVVGDSLTDDFGHADPTPWLEVEQRWTDRVVDRLAGEGVRLGILNDGFIGNRLMPDGLNRIERDIVTRQGITTIVLALGANDVHPGGTTLIDTTALINAYQRAIDDAHAAGMRIVGATIPPYAYWDTSSSGPCYDNPMTGSEQTNDQRRRTVNDAIRNTLAFDAVLDWDQVLKDPAHDNQVKLAYLTDDCVHMSQAGHTALAAEATTAKLTG